MSTLDANKAYAEFCDAFKTILDEHAPLKSKVLRGNHAPFITKELSKGIMTRSRLKTNSIGTEPKITGTPTRSKEIIVFS